jgi:peptidoglycan/LPS O-acetylase OafA/YrhL
MVNDDIEAPPAKPDQIVPQQELTYIPGLDGLRGIAIISVILFHIWEKISDGRILSPLNMVFQIGWIGVDLFFVLSGFLITRILLHTKGAPNYFRRFYIRRFLRIIPLYYLFLVMIALIMMYYRDINTKELIFLRKNIIWMWLYVQNIIISVESQSYSYNINHLWSLAVEEQFYIVWPLIVFILSRRRLLLFALLMVIFPPILRYTLLENKTSWFMTYFFTLCRIDSLGWGALIAILLYRGISLRLLAVVMSIFGIFGLSGLVVIYRTQGGLPFNGVLTNIYGFTCAAIFFAAIILAIANKTGAFFTTIFLENPLLSYIGKISYGLYVFHYPLLFVLQAVALPALGLGFLLSTGSGIALFSIIYVLACVLVASLSWTLFERPIMSLKDRFTS